MEHPPPARPQPPPEGRARPATAPPRGAPLDAAAGVVRGRRVELALAAFLVAASIHAWAAKARDGRDLGVLLTAGGRAIRAESLYRLSDGHWCFKYSPPAALLAAPAAALPPRLASLLLALGSAMALVAILRWAAGQVGARARPFTQVAVVALSLPYALHVLALGQNDAILVAMVVGSEVLATRYPARAGALLAVPCLFKLPYLLLLVIPLAWREWRRLAGAAAGLALAFGGVAVRYGPSGLGGEIRSWRELLAETTPRLLCDEQNQSLWAVACTYLARPWEGPRFLVAVALAGLGLAVALAGLAVAAARDARRRRFVAVAAALYATAPFSPLGWRANLVAAIPLLFLLVEHARAARSRVVRGLSAAVVALVLLAQLATYDLVGREAFSFLLRHRHYALACGAAALAALLGAAVEASRAERSARRGPACTLDPVGRAGSGARR